MKQNDARKMTEEVNAWVNKMVVYQGKELMRSYLMVLKGRGTDPVSDREDNL